MKNNFLAFIIAAIVFGGLGFFAGMRYQQRRTFSREFGKGQAGGGQFFLGNPGSRGTAIRGGFRPVNGEIISADSGSITVKTDDGGSKIVIISAKTSINRAQKVEKTELKTGDRVAVFGSENGDGSVTAQNIQLNPAMR